MFTDKLKLTVVGVLLLGILATSATTQVLQQNQIVNLQRQINNVASMHPVVMVEPTPSATPTATLTPKVVRTLVPATSSAKVK